MKWARNLDTVMTRSMSAEAMLRAATYGLLGRFRYQGSDCRFGRGLVVRGGDHIRIGSGVVLTDHSWLNAVVKADDQSIVISVGDRASLGRRCVISAAESVIIEPEAMIAPGVFITDHLHAFEDADTSIMLQPGLVRVAPVVVRRGAWIGYNVAVMPGVVIGRNAVVGANSVVTHDIPDHAVSAGNPARLLRMRAGRADL